MTLKRQLILIARSSRRRSRSLAAVATLAAAFGVLALPGIAGATTGTAYRGGLYCSTFGYGTDFFGTAPWVRAANLTTGVDKQTVYWNVQMYQKTASGLVKLDDIDPNSWAHTTATDSGYTNTWYTANGTYMGTIPGMVDDGFVNNANARLMWNVLYFYNSNGTFAGSYGFFSAPGNPGTTITYNGSLFLAAGSTGGNGYC